MRVVILAKRISGTDGVSLEVERWREILTNLGHSVSFIAGELDRSGTLIPELHFQWPSVVRIHDEIVNGKGNYKKVEAEIFKIAGIIEGKLRDLFNNGTKVDLLIVPNALSLPMHLPLAVAITRVIEELEIPTIARHHDFWWERKRYLKSSMFPFFERWFPPNLSLLKHVVINSLSQKELLNRKGIESSIIWDTFDFDSRLNKLDKYSSCFRRDLKINKEDIVFLQATRIVPRKRIELSIDLIKKLNNEKVVLVVAGYSGDEGSAYKRKLVKYAKNSGIRYKFIGNRINSRRKIKNGKRIYTLWDSFVNSDFVVYPTKVEGFGNQFVETVYFKKPLIITPYPVYTSDIKPLGFKVIEMSETKIEKAARKVKILMEDKKEKEDMINHNFNLGCKHFSYKWAEKRIKEVFKSMNIT